MKGNFAYRQIEDYMIEETGEQEFVKNFFALMAEVECGNHFVPENPQHIKWLKERIAVQFFRGTKFFALYGDEGMPIGFAAILVEKKLDKVACFRHYSELLGIAVMPLHRGKGYGSVLLQYAEKYAREAGAYCLYASTYANDYDVIHFYGKNGFVPVATLPDVHGPNNEGNVYMRKILNAVPRTASQILIVYIMSMFKALHSDSITLYLINKENLAEVRSRLQGFPDSAYMLQELSESYLPAFEDGIRTNYGFYAMLENKLAGLNLLGISSWKHRRGYTGADTFVHMRGRGVAPRSKPHLFYLAFEILGLNRIETGCYVSNIASKRSIEKTPGFQFEGVLREYGLNPQGKFEDEYRYAILRRDWLQLYDKSQVEVIV